MLRSPLRYPDGKTWMLPLLRKWLVSLGYRPKLFVEPFAGGASASLMAICEDLADRALLVELDPEVAAVWQTVLSCDYVWLAAMIESFCITPDNLRRTLEETEPGTLPMAFRTILKNRTSYGGILVPGVGTMKHGEDGNGIRSRWYPGTLSGRIRDIGAEKESFEFLHGDGIEQIERHASNKRAVFFIDPPYTVLGRGAGRCLYTHNRIDHARLFEVASEMIRGDFLMSYNDDHAVRKLADDHGLRYAPVPMKTGHHSHKHELVIGRDLGWLESFQNENCLRA